MDIILLVSAFEIVDFIFMGKVQQVEGIQQQMFLDDMIEGSFCGEAGTVVDL